MVEITTIISITLVLSQFGISLYSTWDEPNTNWYEWTMTHVKNVWYLAVFVGVSNLICNGLAFGINFLMPGTVQAVAGQGTMLYNHFLLNKAKNVNNVGLRMLGNAFNTLGVAAWSWMLNVGNFLYSTNQAVKVIDTSQTFAIVTSVVLGIFVACLFAMKFKVYLLVNLLLVAHILLESEYLGIFPLDFGYDQHVHKYIEQYYNRSFWLMVVVNVLYFCIALTVTMLRVFVLASTIIDIFQIVPLGIVKIQVEKENPYQNAQAQEICGNAYYKATNEPCTGIIQGNVQIKGREDDSASIELEGVIPADTNCCKTWHFLSTFLAHFLEAAVLSAMISMVEMQFYKYGFEPILWVWIPFCGMMFGDKNNNYCKELMTDFNSVFRKYNFWDVFGNMGQFLLIFPAIILYAVGGLSVSTTVAAMVSPLQQKISDNGYIDLDTLDDECYLVRVFSVAHGRNWYDRIFLIPYLLILLFRAPIALACAFGISVKNTIRNENHSEVIKTTKGIIIKIVKPVKLSLKMKDYHYKKAYAKVLVSGKNNKTYDLGDKIYDAYIKAKKSGIFEHMFNFCLTCFKKFAEFTMAPFGHVPNLSM